MEKMRVSSRTWRKAVAAIALCALPAWANILDPNVVDFVVVERTGPEVYLDIVQHLPWTQETLTLLDRKVDAYVRYVSRGEFLRKYPDMAGKPVVVRVVYVEPLDPSVRWRLEAVKSRIAPRGVGMTWVPLTSPPKTSSAR
jgi:hypothetical protein